MRGMGRLPVPIQLNASSNLTGTYDDAQDATRTTIQPGATSAIMTARIGSNGNTIIDSDILVNETRLFYGTTTSTQESGGQFHCLEASLPSDKIDFQTALTHELGYTLGLEHTAERACSLYAYVSFGEMRRTLCTSERNAVRGMYGS